MHVALTRANWCARVCGAASLQSEQPQRSAVAWRGFTERKNRCPKDVRALAAEIYGTCCARELPCTRTCRGAPRLPVMSTVFRQLRPEDNPLIARIIRDTLTEFGAAKPGTVYFDPTTDDLFSLFQHPEAHYLVAETDGVVVGGGGLFPTAGLPSGICELVKLYLTPAARGKGLGKGLILRCLEQAQRLGFNAVYLETMNELRLAVGLYESLGFEYLGAPLGQSGHFGCPIWMLKSLP